MRIGIVTPAPPGSRRGNRITALRWARLLRRLGHRVEVAQQYQQQRWHLMVALHARKSHGAVKRFRRRWPERPIVVALTGTDVYGDLPQGNAQAAESVELADALVVLQADAPSQLPPRHRDKTHVIYQSVRTGLSWQPLRRKFRLCVLGHLRRVKDPFRAAEAVAYLHRHAAGLSPGQAFRPLEVCQAGEALSPSFARRAERWQAQHPWYRYLGEVPHHRAMRLLSRSSLLVLSSLMEGGANVVCEAIAVGTPVLSSDIGGTRGLLGADYPGLFPVGDTRALAQLIHRCATEQRFLLRLHRWCAARRHLVAPEREQAAWRKLLARLSLPPEGTRAE